MTTPHDSAAGRQLPQPLRSNQRVLVSPEDAQKALAGALALGMGFRLENVTIPGPRDGDESEVTIWVATMDDSIPSWENWTRNWNAPSTEAPPNPARATRAVRQEESANPRERALQLIRDAGVTGTGASALSAQLRAEGYSTCRQTVQQWLGEWAITGQVLRRDQHPVAYVHPKASLPVVPAQQPVRRRAGGN
ncbi:hypothetical protein [Streptomyces millisiae]|uniref:DNA-binding protein n=1 Tax=Streptomyces millisiae TaxID=3075542 RepID=A0ABU2LZZ5_9ACTN|nr:hypothetical protein [Streptomyces sp. DSM 44918]MDT0323167.1 hypothetical protein [Streptomyces sp. DSM 44918]